MKKIVSCAMVAGLAVVGMGGVCGEKPYDFRKRLDVVHESGRRDPAAKPAADEFVVKDGFVIDGPQGFILEPLCPSGVQCLHFRLQ